jgi:hypothetical protein
MHLQDSLPSLIAQVLQYLSDGRICADKKPVTNTILETPAESEIRFLDYRLDVISRWPPSERKRATAEGISRRITSIARLSLAQPQIDHLLESSCRLLENLFKAG